MYPTNKNPISGINNFLNKQFGLPLPSASTSYGISKPKITSTQNMSYAPNMSYATKPGQNMSYANPSATNSSGTVIKPPVEKKKTTVLPPAGEKFVQDTYDKVTGARTAYGESIGAPDMLGGKPVVKGNETVTNQFGGASMETVAPPKTQESPYLTYLKSMFDPESLKTANTKMTEDYERLAGIQNESEAKELQARRLYEETLDRIGGTVEGARESAALSARRSNSELADLALRESAAARTAGVSKDIYNQMIGAGKSVYEAEIAQAEADKTTAAEGFTLGKDQVRYDAKGNVIAMSGNVQDFGGTYKQGTDPTADAYADAVLSGKTKLENIPEEYRGAVAQAISGVEVTPETSPYLAQIAVQGKQAVKGLMDIAVKNPSIFGKSAAAPIPAMLRSDDFRNYEAQLDYLKGNLIPASLTAMREASKTGGALGQVSDREGAWLASALGALSMNQSSENVVKQLKLIDESLGRWEKAVNTYGNSSDGATEDLWSW